MMSPEGRKSSRKRKGEPTRKMTEYEVAMIGREKKPVTLLNPNSEENTSQQVSVGRLEES